MSSALRTRARLLASLAFHATALALATSGTAHAYGRGIDVAECGGCHGGGRVPEVRFTATPSSFAPGAVVRFRVDIDAVNGSAGGFRIASSGPGAFRVVDAQGTRLSGEDTVIHSAPRTASNGRVTFEVDWVAPASAGDVQLFVAGVSANRDGSSRGDAVGVVRPNLVWGCTPQTVWGDLDADGYGAQARGSIQACGPRAGWSERSDDCDDNDGAAHPGGTEVCNRRDDDCDGTSDEGLTDGVLYPDADGDGYGGAGGEPMTGCGRAGYGAGNEDCDDRDPGAHPGAQEVCGGRDEDCDGRVDERVRPVCGAGMCARASLSCELRDCTPGEPGTETCNAWDDDCDGITDEGDALCPRGERCDLGSCVGGNAPPRDGGLGFDGGASAAVRGGCAIGRGDSASLGALLAVVLAALARGVMRRRRRSAGS